MYFRSLSLLGIIVRGRLTALLGIDVFSLLWRHVIDEVVVDWRKKEGRQELEIVVGVLDHKRNSLKFEL